MSFAADNVMDKAAIRKRFFRRARYLKSAAISPLTAPGLLQRKSVCSCGGVCPKCQGSITLQPKLSIGAANDKYEEEADVVADQVMRMPEPAVQRQVSSEEDEEEEPVHTKTSSRTPLNREKRVANKTAIQNLKGGGRPLPTSARAFFESRMGADFSGVRVHTDSQSANTARALNARAFTHGSNIAFSANQYSPTSREGKHLLAHELTHVIQQQSARSLAPSIQRKIYSRKFHCNKEEAKETEITRGTPLKAVQTAEKEAIKLLTTAINRLKTARRKTLKPDNLDPAISDDVAKGFQDLLGLDATLRTNWINEGEERTVPVIIRRLEIVRDLLDSGWIHYHCFSPKCNSEDYAYAYPGEFHNYLCRKFWGPNVHERAATIIHEALHMSFKKISDSREGGFLNLYRAACYSRLIFLLNGIAAPPGTKNGCPIKEDR